MPSASALLQVLSVPTASAEAAAAPARDTGAANLFSGLMAQLMSSEVTADAETPAEPAPAVADTTSADAQLAALVQSALMPAVAQPVSPPVAADGETPDEPVDEDARAAETTPVDAQLAALVQSALMPALAQAGSPPVAADGETPDEPVDEDARAAETTPADAQLTALVQSVLVPPVARPEPKSAPVQAPLGTAPETSQLPDLPATEPKPDEIRDAATAPKADIESIKTELSALRLETPEAIKPTPVEAPRPAFSLQPVPAETTATPYTPANTIAAQASALSHAAVEQLNQLSVAIQKRLSAGTTKFQLELKPADLGRIDVALTITAEGKVNAHLEFDTPITATTFAARESELRQQLTAAGLKVDGDALTFSSRPTESASSPSSQTSSQTSSQSSSQTSNQTSNQTGNLAAFTDQPNGQQARPHPRQAARALKQADQNAAEADLDASLAQLRQRPGTRRLALDLTV
ncbi:flagellar hook length determination-like protein [Asticcacaulis biprosthecium C19]|uniref:Flagellar hook length determination-like protein n=1 Tax=Asticcacaulis biprosthecium C19 TaxID=715226 RepID=F4QMK4_9CAUL|nr:flagellar hook-length control protein FliK [Asticcacaulis biprosthecium]EGF91445.1 flagellar hook length determination-like protein [Asticcacaulis biprosthecium C19]